MALITKDVKRIFKITKKGETIELADPNPNFSPDEVLSFYTNSYPELTTSTVAEPTIVKDDVVYEFKTTVGTKG